MMNRDSAVLGIPIGFRLFGTRSKITMSITNRPAAAAIAIAGHDSAEAASGAACGGLAGAGIDNPVAQRARDAAARGCLYGDAALSAKRNLAPSKPRQFCA